MARTFMERAAEAQAVVPVISVAEAQQRLRDDPRAVVIDVRDAELITATGIIPGAHHVTFGSLLYKADHTLPAEWQDPVFADKDRPIITTCETSELASIAAKELQDMDYTNVAILEGGTVGWKNAGLETNPFPGA
jgi:rhodanese-related sulfurtransferase